MLRKICTTKGKMESGKNIKFVMLDFEFAPFIKQDIVLVSGAVSGSLGKNWHYKFQGTPLLMSDYVRPIRRNELKRVISNIKRIFKNKKDRYLQPIKDQLNQSLNTRYNTLKKDYIENGIYFGTKEPIVVVWNGQMEMKILEKLDIHVRTLNLSAMGNTVNYFVLELKDMRTNVRIYSTDLGVLEKSGHMLNLEEMHDLICTKKHDSNSHDPVHDVTQTKCIFNFIVEEMGYIELINKLKQ